VIIMRDAPVTRLDVIVIDMKGAELMVLVQLTTACLVVSVKTTTAAATEMMDVGTICTALRAIMMVSVVTIITAAVIVTGTAPLATVSATGLSTAITPKEGKDDYSTRSTETDSCDQLVPHAELFLALQVLLLRREIHERHTRRNCFQSNRLAVVA
jgi:hypothetical protein